MFNLKKTFALTALAAVSAVNVANAGVIDTFIYTENVVVSDKAVYDYDTDTLVGGSLTQEVANGTNDYSPAGNVAYSLSVSQDGNNAPTKGDVGLSYTDGSLAYSSESSDQGVLSITYKDISSWDITDGNGYMSFYFDVIDSGASGFDLTIGLTDNESPTAVFEEVTTSIAGGIENSRVFLGLSSFVNVNLEEISQMTFTFDSGLNGDFALAEIGTVPEPTSLAILGLGVLGFAASRKKKA